MTTFNTKYFASIINEEAVAILYCEDGQAVTRIMDDEFASHSGYIYDVNTGMGTEWENTDGIVLTHEDAKLLNVEFVDYR